jgi:hypothetical protein
MEDSVSLTAEHAEKCAACYTNVLAADVFCTNCGYPLQGSEQEQRNFIANQEVVNLDYADFNKQIKNAGNSLYYLAGIFLLSTIVNFFISKDDPEVLYNVIPLVVLSALFLILGGYSRKKPLACIVSGLALYIIVQVLLAIDNPVNIFGGIIIKIIIIGYMIRGIKSALEMERFKKEHNIS